MAQYRNRRWEIEEYNIHGNPVYGLHFAIYGMDEEIILKFVKDEDANGYYMYTSEFMNVEDDFIAAGSEDEAKEQFEDMIICYVQDQISELEAIIDNFNEKE